MVKVVGHQIQAMVNHQVLPDPDAKGYRPSVPYVIRLVNCQGTIYCQVPIETVMQFRLGNMSNTAPARVITALTTNTHAFETNLSLGLNRQQTNALNSNQLTARVLTIRREVVNLGSLLISS